MRPTIDQIRGIGDLATSFRWDLAFSSLPAALTGFSSEDLNVRCETSTIPKRTLTNSEVAIRGHKIKRPGVMEYDKTLTLSFFETVDNLIKNFIKAWGDVSWEPGTGVRPPSSEIEATLILRLLDNNDSAIWQFRLVGCLYEDADLGTLDAETDSFKPSLTISYDYYKDKAL